MWKAGKSNGYGRFRWDGQVYYAHNFAYRVTFGELKPGYVCDHLCENKDCVNPEHLEEVPYGENIRRGTLSYWEKKREKGKRVFDE